MSRKEIEGNLQVIQENLAAARDALNGLDPKTAKQCLGAATRFFILINRAIANISEDDRAWVVAEYGRLIKEFQDFPSIKELVKSHAYFLDPQTASFAQTGRPRARRVEIPSSVLRDGWSNR